jgi:16S rRNA processing protein RimM
VSSPDAGWVAVALLGKTRGNRGEITALALSSKPERYESLREVYLVGKDDLPVKYDVEHTWFHDSTLIFKFLGVDSISDAEALIGREVRVPFAERVTLDPGEYFESDILGCEVIDRRTGESLGRVEQWDDAGGGGILVVAGLMIPFARQICVAIDTEAKRIEVELPEGLRDINT